MRISWVVAALPLLLACSCNATPRDCDTVEAQATSHPASAESEALQSQQSLPIQWDASVMEVEIEGRRSTRSRLTAAYDPQALGGELRVARLDPQGINPNILVVSAWIDPEPADDTTPVTSGAPSPEGYWILPFAGKEFVQIVGPAGRPGLITIRR
jgi:hypothetical protein